MTDPTPNSSDTESTTPLPASEAAVPPPPAAAPVAPVATTTSAKSPWPWLLPVLVGVGALLLGGILGGAAGFTLGSHRGPVGQYLEQGPGQRFDGPGNGDRQGPFGGDGGRPDGQFQFGGAAASGTITSVADGKVTIELSNGDTLTYSTDDDTQVVQVDSSSVDDLAEGDEVTVLGSRDDNGDRVARLIRTGDALR
jgi:hypothetical protein